jgi:hypothetical protein
VQLIPLFYHGVTNVYSITSVLTVQSAVFRIFKFTVLGVMKQK